MILSQQPSNEAIIDHQESGPGHASEDRRRSPTLTRTRLVVDISIATSIATLLNMEKPALHRDAQRLGQNRLSTGTPKAIMYDVAVTS